MGGGSAMRLYLRPWTVRQAIPFVAMVHRKLPRVQGGLWAVSVREAGRVVGCAIVGHPARTQMEDNAVLCVVRVAVIEGHKNACSMLYGACARAAKSMGADSLVTYTHDYESGVSLKAAGWVDGGMTKGGEHDRATRRRAPAVDASPKRRWWAPWSKALQQGVSEDSVAAHMQDVRTLWGDQ